MALAVAVGLGIGLAVAVGVGVGVPQTLPKISIVSVGVVGAYPPASQILLTPSLSVGKLRRAVINAGTGVPVVQLFVLKL